MQASTFGKTLVNVEYLPDAPGVAAKFANVSTASGTVLIGADGTRSKVGELLVGVEIATCRRANQKYLALSQTILPESMQCCKPRFYQTRRPSLHKIAHIQRPISMQRFLFSIIVCAF